MGDAVDIDAARGDIGRDQHPGRPLGNRRARARAAPCDLLPWIASASMPAVSGCARRLIGAVLGAGEDQSARRSPVAQHVGQEDALGRRSTKMTRWSIRSTVGGDGVTAILTGRGASRGQAAMARGIVAENSSVWRRGQLRDDRADVMDEAHVEHAVGFVEDEESRRSTRRSALRLRGRAAGPASRRGCRRR